ncbi:MAG: PAS domain S-box protein [Elusimicrobiota bacterium]
MAKKKAQSKKKKAAALTTVPLSSVIDSNPEPVYVINPEDYTVIYANPAALALWSLRRLPEGIKCYELTHGRALPCDAEGEACTIKLLKQTKQSVTLEHSHKDEKGRQKKMKILGRPIYDGKSLLCVIEHQMDMSRRVNKNEERFHQLFESLNICVAVYRAVDGGRDFVFVDFNNAAERTEKVQREHVVGRSLRASFPGVEMFGLFDVLKRVWKTGRPEHHPVGLYKDQRICGYRENYVYKLPMGDVVAVYQDRTRQLRAADDVQETKKTYKLIFENAPHLMLSVDADGTIAECNDRASTILGRSKERLLGQPLSKLVHPELHGKLNDLLEELGEAGFARRRSFVLKHFDGTDIEVIVDANSLAAHGETPVRIILSIRDNTEQKKLENALIDSEQRYRALFENAPDGFVIVDVKTRRLTGCNKIFCAMLGYSEKEFLKLSVLDCHSKEAHAKVHADFKKLFRGESAVVKSLPFKRKDGSIIHLSGSTSRVTVGGRQFAMGTFRKAAEPRPAKK